MPVLENPRYERFSQIVADGKMRPTAAYREVAGANAKDPDANSCKWMKRPEIAARIEELKAKASARCSMSRDQFVESLVQMYQGQPGEAALNNPLCDSLITRGQRFAVFPPKATIAAQLSKLCGWDGPAKVEVEAGENLTGFLGRLFVGSGTLGSRIDGNGERSSSKEASGSAAIRH
jgi:hypothetical protein